MSPQSSLASLWDMDRHKRHPHGLHHAVLSCLAMAVSQVIPENNRNRSHPLKKGRQREDLYGIVVKLANDLTDAARCT